MLYAEKIRIFARLDAFMKKIAALTMVRNDRFFLKKWVDYYGRELGKENLHIFFDGLDQEIEPFCEGTKTQLVSQIRGNIVSTDKERIVFLSERAAELLASDYDIVIGVDVDEFIVVDPKAGKSLREYLSEARIRTSISALGMDFGQKIGEEGDITDELPFLNQRQYARIGTRYTKPSVISRPCRWGSGFHRIKRHNFHIAKDLYLFHFGYFDKRLTEERMNDADRLSQGWGKHMDRRARTIRLATECKARDFDVWARFARICQTIVRQPHSWNKPAMFNLNILVRIPERFRDIV